MSIFNEDHNVNLMTNGENITVVVDGVVVVTESDATGIAAAYASRFSQ